MGVKQDRTAVRTAGELERKLGQERRLKELLGLIDDTRDRVASVRSTLESEIADQYTAIMRDCTQVTAEALKFYVSRDELSEYEKTVSSSLKLASDRIGANVKSTESLKKSVELCEEQIDEQGASIEESKRTIEKNREDSEAAISLLSEKITLSVSGIEENANEIAEQRETILENGEELSYVKSEITTLRSDAESSIEQLSESIRSTVSRTEENRQLLSEQGTYIDEQGERLDSALYQVTEYKNSQESYINELPGQIALGVSAAREYTDSVRDSLAGELKDSFATKDELSGSFALYEDRAELLFMRNQSEISSLDGKYSSQHESMSKHITFSEDGIIIGSGDGAITLSLDNEGIVFKKGAETFGLWDGNYFYTGNMVVRNNERVQLGSFAFVPRSNGNLSFLKVGE